MPAAFWMGEVGGCLSLALIILFALSPRIIELSMGFNSLDSKDVFAQIWQLDDGTSTPIILGQWQTKVKSYMEIRLEKLKIMTDNLPDYMRLPGDSSNYFNWFKFERLRYLAVPLIELVSCRQLSLADTIHTLRIDLNLRDLEPIGMPEVVDHLTRSKNGHVCLHEIELRFTCNVLSTA